MGKVETLLLMEERAGFWVTVNLLGHLTARCEQTREDVQITLDLAWITVVKHGINRSKAQTSSQST